MLCQKYISAVQAYGLVLLNHLDIIDRAEQDARQLKRSLVAAGNWDYTKLFPEYAVEEEVRDVVEGEEIPTDATWDTSAVEWMSPSEDPEEFERLMALLNEKPGTFSGSDVLGADRPVSWSNWE